MTTTSLQKKENIPPRPDLRLDGLRTPEQLFEIEFKEHVVALKVPDAHERPRRLAKIAADELFPLRVFLRYLNDGLSVDIDPMALYRSIAEPLKRFFARKTRRRLPARRDDKLLPAG